MVTTRSSHPTRAGRWAIFVSCAAVACGARASAPSGPERTATPVAAEPSPARASRGTPVATFECSPTVCPAKAVVASFELQTRDVVLANTTRSSPLESLPTVLRGAGSMGSVLDFTTTPDESHVLGWVAAALLEDRRTIVGVIDTVIESPGPELIVVTSGDTGETWRRRATIQKPHYTAQVRDVKAMSAKDWIITLDLDDCAGCGVKPGTYLSKTADAGGTFTPFVLK